MKLLAVGSIMLFGTFLNKHIAHRKSRWFEGQDVAEGLATLAAIEAQLDAIHLDQTGEVSFRLVGNWLIRDEILWAQLKHTFSLKSSRFVKDIAGFPVHNLFSSIHQLLLAKRVWAHTSAKIVIFRRNLRAFYDGQRPLTLWIGRPPLPPNLTETMAIRSRFALSPQVKVPRILTQATDGEPPYMLEELLRGRRIGRPEDSTLVDQLVTSLFQFYDRGRIRHRRSVDIYDIKLLSREITELSLNLYWQKTWVSRAMFLKAAEQCLHLRDETLPLCIGHGDLGKSNILVTANGEIALLDWENARELPMAADLLKLLYMYPQLTKILGPEMRQRTEDAKAMPPKRQFLLETLNRIVSWANPGAEYLYDRAKHRWRKRMTRFYLGVASMLISGPDW